MPYRPLDFRATVAALALLHFTPGATRAQEPQRPPEFTARVDLVTVEVTVLDRTGQPVPGLAKEAFSLYEDGVRQEIAAFETIDVRARIVFWFKKDNEPQRNNPQPVITINRT